MRKKNNFADNLGNIIAMSSLFIIELVAFIYLMDYAINKPHEKTTDFLLAGSITLAIMSTLVVALLCLLMIIAIICDMIKEEMNDKEEDKDDN